MDTVLITGASRGLGLEFAKQYSAEGARVHATCRNPAGAHELKNLEAAFDNLTVHSLNVGNEQEARAFAQELEGQPLDILINNAGVFGPEEQSIGGLDYEAFRDALNVNLLGPTQLCEAFLPHLERGNKKRMVTITSGMGSIADSGGGYYVYRASKAGVNMVMHSLALDLRERGIICVVMNPGWVQTDMGGDGAKITPEQSIRGMREVIGSLTLEDTGKFLDYRKGKTFPW